MNRIHLIVGLLVLFVGGCGKAGAPADREFAAAPPQAKQAGKEPAGADAAPVPRKIIYTGNLHVIVDDFDKAQEQLDEMVKAHKGYVAKADVTGMTGTRRNGHWVVRVPVEEFGSFQKTIARLGELQRNSLDAQDVTDQFYDLEARIKSRQVEEQRLLKHMEVMKPDSKLDDILAVERELSRVRREIEQEQGQLQRLAKLTAYSTIDITIQERKDYVPVSSPSFGTSISRTFSGSLEGLLEVGKVIVLVVVAVTPWLLVLAVFVVPAILILRRFIWTSGGPLQVVPAEEGPSAASGSPS